jgi:hypothetical protein
MGNFFKFLSSSTQSPVELFDLSLVSLNKVYKRNFSDVHKFETNARICVEFVNAVHNISKRYGRSSGKYFL